MQNPQSKKAIIIGAGIAGPAMAMQLKKINIEPTIFEARTTEEDNEGVFLGITPNGLNVLKEFVPLENIKKEYTPGTMCFFNAKNKQIGVLETKHQLEKYQAETIQIKRSALNHELRKAAIERGIRIEYGKKLIDIAQTDTYVTATFADGSQYAGNMLIACDGTYSVARKILFPDAPKPAYTKLLSTGGFARLPNMEHLFGSIRMIFGERGFFAYAVSNTGEVWWFNNFYRVAEPTREEIKTSLKSEIKSQLLEIHRNDPEPILEILRASADIAVYPTYDIPSLQKWYKGNVCLIGDAAHATAPHIGQGASLALEDTLVLAKCIRDLPTLNAAFEKFTQLRQPRVQKLIKEARKVGDTKSKANPVMIWFRDRFLGFFIQFEIKKLDWVYGYRVNWDVPIE